jgi:hypothetical protein
VMTRSRVWFLIWVGKLTCWTRLIGERRFRQSDARGSEGLSAWILKSSLSKRTHWKWWQQVRGEWQQTKFVAKKEGLDRGIASSLQGG